MWLLHCWGGLWQTQPSNILYATIKREGKKSNKEAFLKKPQLKLVLRSQRKPVFRFQPGGNHFKLWVGCLPLDLYAPQPLWWFLGGKPSGGNNGDLKQQQLQAQLGEGSGCVHTSAGTTAVDFALKHSGTETMPSSSLSSASQIAGSSHKARPPSEQIRWMQ